MVNPKFIYNEKVIVKNGFYMGQEGFVRKHSKLLKTYKILIQLSTYDYLWFKEKNLKSLDNPNKDFDNKLEKLTK